MVLRRRPYKLLVTEVAGPTGTGRATVLTPRPGYRIRLVRLRMLQTARGLRDEPISVRHRGIAPSTPLRIFIDYTEEP